MGRVSLDSICSWLTSPKGPQRSSLHHQVGTGSERNVSQTAGIYATWLYPHITFQMPHPGKKPYNLPLKYLSLDWGTALPNYAWKTVWYSVV